MKRMILLSIFVLIVLSVYSADINVNGYTLHQNNSTQSIALPDTTIPEGWYMIVARNATQAAFETEWGTLPANVIYFNSGGSCPQINGGENYYITDGASAIVDSALAILSSGNTAERDSTNVNTWTQSVRTDGTPGSGAVDGFNAGLIINEYSDAVTFSNEFVEIYNDGSGAAFNIPPSVSTSHNPDPLRDGDDLSIVAIITDDSGISADTMFGRLNGGSWNSWLNDSVSGNNYYYTNLGSFNEGDVVDYFVKAVDDSSAATYSDTTSINVQALPTGDSLNINNYQIKQYSASYTYTFGDITLYDGDYIVIGRNADQAAFETFWGVSLPSNVTYINGSNSALSINGGETFSLHDETSATIDSSTTALTGGNTVQRDATNLNTWTQSADTDATPGSGVTGGNNAGFVITEYSDASGTGNYIYEFVEVYLDVSGTASNTPPVIDSMKALPYPVEPADDVVGIGYMHDDSGIFADTCFFKIGNAGSWTSLQTDSVSGQAYYYPLGTFSLNDTVYVYIKAVDDSNGVTISDTNDFVVQLYIPEFSNVYTHPGIVYSGNTTLAQVDIIDQNGTIVLNRMYFWVNGEAVNNVVSDSINTDTYFYTFGSFNEGDTVSYYFYGRDNSAHSSFSDTFGFTVLATPNYDIKVNEFCSNGPSVGDASSEWIELYNIGGSTIDISNYSISDEEGSFSIPSGTSMGAGEFFVLVNNIDSFNAYFTLPGGVNYFEYKDSISGSFGLSNSGDQIILSNSNSVNIDYVNYGTGTTPAPNPGDGESASRLPDGMDTDNCTNDFSLLTIPTPGSGQVSGPSISGLTRSPILPLSGEGDTIQVTVTDPDGIWSVQLVTSSYDSTSIDTFTMNLVAENTYLYIIPAKTNGCRFEYYVYAVDNDADTTISSDRGRFFWGYTSIPDIKEVNAVGYPRYFGYQLRSTGIATTPSNVYSSYADIINFQENYRLGAVLKTDSSAPNVIPGDSITATGTIGMWNGQTRIEDPYSGLIIHSSGHVIDTIYITADDLMDTTGEAYEGLLAQIYTDGIYSGTWPSSGSSAGLWMNNHDPADISKGNISDTFYMWVDGDTDIDESSEPVWNVRIIGIISQYDVSSPYFNGYQIMPRGIVDLNTTITALKNFYVSLSVINNGISLNWNIQGINNISSYRIERREMGEATYKVLGSVSPDKNTYTDNTASLSTLYQYRILVLTTDGNAIAYKEIQTTPSMLITASSLKIDDNPVNMGTWMRYVSPMASHMNAAVYDITGREILSVFDGQLEAGHSNIYVNTSNIAAGIYFLKVNAGDFNETIKLNIIK